MDVEELWGEGVGTRGPEIAVYFLQEAVCNGSFEERRREGEGREERIKYE